MSVETDAFELEGKARVILYRMVLPGGTTVYLSPKASWTWQGNLYEEHPCHMSQVSRQADGKVSRPKFTIANPQAIFSASVATGVLENSLVTRYRVMKEDLEEDLDISLRETLRVSRVVSSNRESIVLELRGALDGVNFRLPFRTFHPPEFPHVSLS